MRFRVWWIWAYALLLIAFSFYSIFFLPSHRKQWIFPVLSPNHLSGTIAPSIVVFSAPGKFIGAPGIKQRLAIRSWLDLSPELKVVLFSQDQSAAQFSSAYVSRVTLDSSIDFTFHGTPFFHSMVERSRTYPGDISVFVDPETVLLPDLVSTLTFANAMEDDWLIFASPIDKLDLPLQLDDSHVFKSIELQELPQSSVPKNDCNDNLLLAWNNRKSSLHAGVLPPFLFGKGYHNRWIIHEAIMSPSRYVFDASWSISTYDYYNNSSSNHNWERSVNEHLASAYGSLLADDLHISHVSKVLRCKGQFMFFGGQSDELNQKLFKGMNWSEEVMGSCIAKYNPENRKSLSCLETELYESTQPSLPFPLETLASLVADNEKTIVLSVAGYSYRDMLMSWVCRLRHLHVTNFLVCALDLETYTFSILQGLPVFFHESAPKNISYDDCHFGTKCFQRVTKVKSRIVLKLLKLGYNVLLSDVDIYWFSNPLPYLKSFDVGVLVAQSDEFSLKGPVNLPRRLNSGFYFCRSDGRTIAAMKKVVKHAATSKLSEQPSFYDTLCGHKGAFRVGDNLCVERKTNLTVHFLDRNLFPNGAYRNLWLSKNVTARCRKLGCLILHNNWISGRSRKLERQISADLWDYDESRRMCLFNDYAVVSYS